MNPGIVLFNTVQNLSVDTSARKLLVVLNDGQHYPFITVATTSKPCSLRGVRPGCQARDKLPSFYLPLHSTYLKEETWIQLDRFVDMDPSMLIQGVSARKLVKVCRLPKKILKDLFICAISCKDILENQEKELWKMLANIEKYYQKTD